MPKTPATASPKSPKKNSPATIQAFQLSKSMTSLLPAEEKPEASKTLWDKSSGKCALCGLPLDLNIQDSVVADHRIPRADGGLTELSNLYLAHRTCNSSRQHLAFDIAQPLVHFRAFAEQKRTVDFDQVLDEYVPTGRKLAAVKELDPKRWRISFAHDSIDVPVFEDPSTAVKYFFVEVPKEYILNDKQIQPRLIIPTHVRKLALDFLERPVHEPSNCRLIMKSPETAELLQFDGQHKTTAQILIGRDKLPFKIYVDPPIDMLQSLVIKIQQEIKKQPLTRSDTLAKIGDVIKRYLEDYVEKPGVPRTEKGLIASQDKPQQPAVKRLLLEELRRIIYFDEENRISKVIRPGEGNAPTTDKIVVEHMIGPLLYSEPLEVDIENSTERDTERANILHVLNGIADAMLPPTWDKLGNELQKKRAQRFFYQGSIRWWMTAVLIPALRYVLVKMDVKKPLLIEPFDEVAKDKVLTLIDKLCSWPIWSTDDPDQIKAMRSNTIKNVTDEFPEYTYTKLLKDAKVV
jgi:hypothetical protein